MLKMCLNWKVLAGFAVLGVGIYAVAPSLAAAALPILLLAICPLSMLFMMKGLQGGQGTSRAGEADPTREERLARLKAQHAALDEEIGALEQAELRPPTTRDVN